MVKRVINGKAYNTDTATRIADNLHTVPGDLPEIAEVLYETKHGAYFLLWCNTLLECEHIKPLSDAEAQTWCENTNQEGDIVERAFGKFPEAGASETRTTLRLPGNLHQRASASAAAQGVSLNTYIRRLLERTDPRQAGE